MIAKILIGFFLFMISYFDEFYLGFVKFGIAWKALLALYMLFQTVLNRNLKFEIVCLVGFFYFVKGLIYDYTSYDYFVMDVSEYIKFFVLPVALQYVITNGRGPESVDGKIKFLSIWLPITVLPFLIGMEPYELKETHSLDIFGSDSGYEFSGIFGNKTVASVTLSTIAIVIFKLYAVGALNYFQTTILGFLAVYGVYITYSRTGLLSLIVGSLVYFFQNNNNKTKAYMWLFAITSLVISISIYLYFTDEIFAMRLTGQNVYNQSSGSIEELGSGRTFFWENALLNPIRSGFLTFVIGAGQQSSMDAMDLMVGLRVFSHNGFLDSYQNSGLIGFSIFLYFYYVIYGFIDKNCINSWRSTVFALYYQMVLVQITQGGYFFWVSIIFCLVVYRASVIDRKFSYA